jgi:hypothetical protein
MDPRKVLFWAAVGGTAILANFALELAADKIPSPGLRKLVGYIHRGPGGSTA